MMQSMLCMSIQHGLSDPIGGIQLLPLVHSHSRSFLSLRAVLHKTSVLPSTRHWWLSCLQIRAIASFKLFFFNSSVQNLAAMPVHYVGFLLCGCRVHSMKIFICRSMSTKPANKIFPRQSTFQDRLLRTETLQRLKLYISKPKNT